MKLKFEKKYIYFGITAFLVIAASICFYYLLFHWDRFSARIDSIVKIASPVLYGMILAYLLTPLVNTLERKFLIPAFTRKSKISSKKKKGIRFISITLTIIIVISILFIVAYILGTSYVFDNVSVLANLFCTALIFIAIILILNIYGKLLKENEESTRIRLKNEEIRYKKENDREARYARIRKRASRKS